ncbi:hypothetical protein PUN28_018365 [Cardiocondyla obscurior]|uniref:Uncharacterized protein n=1 Tax=Cardiocondyla obscurior TaxID=286306 RepID=A0AAW2EKW7_9HYME
MPKFTRSTRYPRCNGLINAPLHGIRMREGDEREGRSLLILFLYLKKKKKKKERKKSLG